MKEFYWFFYKWRRSEIQGSPLVSTSQSNELNGFCLE